ncbi:MAG TPA: hypothetical protein VHS31_08665 [Tepidisphaeraceae bacterium]|jgi:hypothetical protein|nr:hypothetical protein [Tepidisphaeraceae bacterium]
MDKKSYVQMQLEEALGDVNRWYCSRYYNKEVTDPETLLRYYIKHGGAEHFAQTRRPQMQQSQCACE